LAFEIIEEPGFIGSLICIAPNLPISTEVRLGTLNTDIEVVQNYQKAQLSRCFQALS